MLSTGALLRCHFLIYRLNCSTIVVPTESQRHLSLFICHLFFHLLNGSLCCVHIISNAVSSDAALKNMSKHSPIILWDCCLCTSTHASVQNITVWGDAGTFSEVRGGVYCSQLCFYYHSWPVYRFHAENGDITERTEKTAALSWKWGSR